MGGKKVLVIEDEKPIARALELKLQHAGYDVEVANDGQQGIERIDANQYDCIISDLVMPKVDGFEVLEHIKTKNLTTPVIILTNLSQEEDQAKAKAMGAKDFFVKSNTPISEIVDHIKAVLR